MACHSVQCLCSDLKMPSTIQMLSIINDMNHSSSEHSTTNGDRRAKSLRSLMIKKLMKLFIKSTLKIDQMLSPSHDNPFNCPHVAAHCIMPEIKARV